MNLMILNRERKAIALRIYKLYRRCHHQLNPGSWSSHSQTILRLSLSRQLDLSRQLERSVCYEYHCRYSMYVFRICVAGKGIFGEGGKVLTYFNLCSASGSCSRSSRITSPLHIFPIAQRLGTLSRSAATLLLRFVGDNDGFRFR